MASLETVFEFEYVEHLNVLNMNDEKYQTYPQWFMSIFLKLWEL